MSDIASKSPELVSVLIIVAMFLKAMNAMLKAQERRDALFLASFNQISQQHIEAREQSKLVIKENTTALTDMTEAVRHLSNGQVGAVLRKTG